MGERLLTRIYCMKLYLGESEDVVDEEQHVLALLVAEVLGHGEAGQGNAGARARRLVHLAVHKGDLKRMGTSF